MRNSTTRAARAIILLACLILIPLVALFGSSLPELAARIMDGEWGRQTASSGEALTEAPVFRPAGEATGPGGDPRGVEVGAVVPAHAPVTPGREMPAGYNVPVGPADSAAPHLGMPGLGMPDAGLPSPGTVEPAALAPGPEVVALPGVACPTGPGVDRFRPTGSETGPILPPSPSEGGTFVRVQERLRDLGAVYYKLESWGSQQQLFRFQCEMAVGGSPGLTRHFEAVDNNPLSAMHKVLVEAEAWHASR